MAERQYNVTRTGQPNGIGQGNDWDLGFLGGIGQGFGNIFGNFFGNLANNTGRQVQDASGNLLLDPGMGILEGQIKEGVPGMGDVLDFNDAEDRAEFNRIMAPVQAAYNDPSLTANDRAILKSAIDANYNLFQSGKLSAEQAIGVAQALPGWSQGFSGLNKSRGDIESYLGGESNRIGGQISRMEGIVSDPNKIRTDAELGARLRDAETMIGAEQRTGMRLADQRAGQRGVGFSGKALADSLAAMQAASTARRGASQGIQQEASMRLGGETGTGGLRGEQAGVRGLQSGIEGNYQAQRGGIVGMTPVDPTRFTQANYANQVGNLGIQNAGIGTAASLAAPGFASQQQVQSGALDFLGSKLGLPPGWSSGFTKVN